MLVGFPNPFGRLPARYTLTEFKVFAPPRPRRPALLPLEHKILFFVFALIASVFGVWGFYRLFLRVRRGVPATEARWDKLPERLSYALRTSLTQERTFRRRPWVSVLHAFIFYGFTYYLLVNIVDGLEGYVHFNITSANPLGAIYNVLADILSFLVLVGVVSLVIRRLFTPSKRDFKFTEKTLLHPSSSGTSSCATR